MNLDTAPAYKTTCTGEINLLSARYFPNEDRRQFKIEVTHGTKYRTDCASCQAGVTYIKQAFDYLNNGFIVWNKEIIEQTSDQVTILIGTYRREFLLKESKVCVLDCEPTVENILEWFCKTFQGQLELAHANIITISSEGISMYKALGY
jgi:hypothetical protein